MKSYREKGLVDQAPSNPSLPKTKSRYTTYLKVQTQYDEPPSDDEAVNDNDSSSNDASESVEAEYDHWVRESRPSLIIDQLAFWEVSKTISIARPDILTTSMAPVEPKGVPHYIPYNNGLLAYPGFLRPCRTCFLIQCRDRHGSQESYHSPPYGGSANDQIPHQA